MDIILEFLSKNMDYVINVCGVIVAVLLVGNFVVMPLLRVILIFPVYV